MISENILSTSEGQIRYQLNRSSSRKKTMQIVVQPPDKVIVSVPAQYSQEQITHFIQRKSAWILNKLKFFKDLGSACLAKKHNRHTCFYLGKEYPVVYLKSSHEWGKIDFDQKQFFVYIPETVSDQKCLLFVKDFFLKWFKARALLLLNERIKLYSQKIGVVPVKINIRSARRLWGSCHPIKRILHFNWKVLMMPIDTLDYVVVHELCHIRVPNHSKDFWNLVRQYVSDFKRHHAWLKMNGHLLVLP